MIVHPVGALGAHRGGGGVVRCAVHLVMAAIATDANLDSMTRFPSENGFLFFYAKIKSMAAKYFTTGYRYPYEYIILVITIVVVLLVIAFTAAATVCTSAIFVPFVVVPGYYAGRNRHGPLISQAELVTPQSAPEMIPLMQANSTRLQVEPVNVFIVPSNQLNAYTFGMDSPKAIVLYSSLFKIMDQ